MSRARIIRLTILAGALTFLVFALASDAIADGWAIIPGLMLASAVGHALVIDIPSARMRKALERPHDVRPAADFEIDRDLYPFESRWFESSVGRVHYVDEGAGRPILLLHGNPDWSFLYRAMIHDLRGDFRVVSLDYPGFGLSDHPEGYGFRPADHAAVVSELVEHLDLRSAVIVGQDWGGPIGMDVASRDPERFTSLVFGNTFWFPALRSQRVFGGFMGLPLMQDLVLRRNLFVRSILPRLLQTELSVDERRHYVDVAPTYASRLGHARFVASINAERDWLEALERRVDATLLAKPMLRVLGMRDKPLTTKEFLAKWDEKFPEAVTLDLPDAGHFWQEDAPEAVSKAIREFASDTSDVTA